MMRPRVRIGMASCGLAAGAEAVRSAILDALPHLGLEADVGATGCLGICHREVLVELTSPGEEPCVYGDVTAENAPALLGAHFIDGERLGALVVHDPGRGRPDPGLAAQDRIVLQRAGRIDPESLDAYRETGGFAGLERALRLDPSAVRAEVTAAGLRGRGGGGFPTGVKWARTAASPDPVRFLICNADEGDPGAFMDRGVLESDPFAVLEGMLIAGWAIGASQGIVYVRFEYPLAGARLASAIGKMRSAGLLGDDILGSGFRFDVVLRRGAGAFVCGEETALIASLEGERGEPRLRPPYPSERGLHGHPTCINNVETLATVPFVLREGAAALRARGTAGSAGTKVFCLAGDVRRGGMVEVPMGTTLRVLVEEVGGGTRSGLPVKAVQIGGPSGGCLPAELLDTPIDYDALAATGTMMGSGGIVVLDASRCMVDVARYFIRFMRDESCGKCTPCREGTPQLTAILDRIAEGQGTPGDLAELEGLGRHVALTSLCGLGRTAPNPVLTILRYFPEELEAHVHEARCPTLTCRGLIRYAIDGPNCDGCGVCVRTCPTSAISLPVTQIAARLDDTACIRCDACRGVCPFDAIEVRS